MAFVIGKHKCCFCGEKGGFFHSVHDFDIYGDVGKRIFYHPECLEMVELSPEKFGHAMMDMALNILQLKKRGIETHNIYIQKKFKDKVESLQAAHFEAMMPKKTTP